ncbi:MAG: DUF350 domain-containing protein [Verrucomicrobia bacterium]|nr:DUF350 domain-containing protein [Verrucomicrobiota bacterium]
MPLPHIPLFAETTPWEGLSLFAIYGLAGIVLAAVSYKLFDKLTPGDLHREIFENKNAAAAILAASVIIGVSLILAAAMGG